MIVLTKTIKQRMRTHWQILLQGGVWIMTLLSSFVLPPPLWDFKEDAIWFRFVHFLVSALIGLLFIPMRSWSEQKHQWTWWWITALALVIGIFVFFEYQSLRAHWTRGYGGERIVVGQTYTEDALEYKRTVRTKDQREISDEELIMDYAGDTEQIWKAGEIRSHRLILAAVYMGSISLFAIIIMTLVQAIYCSTRNKKRAKRGPSPKPTGGRA